MKEKLKAFLPILVMIAILTAFLLPKKLEEMACNDFGEPLFTHAVPEGARIVEKQAAKDETGGVTAALILQTDWTSEALETFYSDREYPPMEEGQKVTLQAKPLDEASIEALKEAKLYEEGASYQFVYLYSK